MFYRVRKLYLDTLHRCIGDWRYFLYDEHKKEVFLLRNHYRQHDECRQTAPVAIYMANGLSDHAGLCDRFKGMTAIYGWCKRHDMDFRISHTHPFDLADYLQPNQYDWRIDSSSLCYNSRYTSVNYAMLNNLVRKQMNSGEVVHLEEQWFNQRLKGNKLQHHIYTNFYPESNRLFGHYFRELFRPAPRLAKALSGHQQVLGNDYVSVSFRFVQLLGDFRDCDGETLQPNEQQDLIRRSTEAVKAIKALHPAVSHILVTADSPRFLQAARQLPYVYIIEGRVGHISFEHSDDVNMKTFLDFLTIAGAQKVYLARSGKMYNSDFARRAAMINNRQFQLFEY